MRAACDELEHLNGLVRDRGEGGRRWEGETDSGRGAGRGRGRRGKQRVAGGLQTAGAPEQLGEGGLGEPGKG